MEIDPTRLSPRHSHDLITGSIVPRPIAWVTSINEAGQINIAPFSFFTGVSWAPPIIAFSVVNRAGGTEKDTLVNIRKSPEFVINVVSVELLSVMESTAEQIPYGEDESLVKGIHLIPSKKIEPGRIQEAKISFECSLERIVNVSQGADAGNLILGRVVLAHIKDDLLKNKREVDWSKLDALGRLSGKYYCTTRTTLDGEMN